jgi:hypothetical protein
VRAVPTNKFLLISHLSAWMDAGRFGATLFSKPGRSSGRQS